MVVPFWSAEFFFIYEAPFSSEKHRKARNMEKTPCLALACILQPPSLTFLARQMLETTQCGTACSCGHLMRA